MVPKFNPQPTNTHSNSRVFESLFPGSSSEPCLSYELMIPAERRGEGVIKVGSSQHLIRILSMHSIFTHTHKSYLIRTFHDSSPAKVWSGAVSSFIPPLTGHSTPEADGTACSSYITVHGLPVCSCWGCYIPLPSFLFSPNIFVFIWLCWVLVVTRRI